MAAELVVEVADLVPPCVRVPLQPHPRHGACCAGRRRHDSRVKDIKQNEEEERLGRANRAHGDGLKRAGRR